MSFTVDSWREELETAAPDLPWPFLRKWMEIESGGNPASAGMFNREAGIFQTYHPDDDNLGITFAELRAGAGPDFQALNKKTGKMQWHNSQTVVSPELVNRAAQVRSVGRVYKARAAARTYIAANNVPWFESGGDFWSLVKLHHALPGLYRFLGAFTSAHGRPPETWTEWRSWVEALSEAEVVAIAPAVATWKSLAERQRMFSNAERCGQVVGNFEPPVELPDPPDEQGENNPEGFDDEPEAAADLLDLAADLLNPAMLILGGIGLVWAVTHGIK